MLKTDDTKAEVLYVRDEVRKMQGLYNPEKDQALKDFGDLRSQLGDFLANKIRMLENQVEDKVVSIIFVITLCRDASRHWNATSGLVLSEGILRSMSFKHLTRLLNSWQL